MDKVIEICNRAIELSEKATAGYSPDDHEKYRKFWEKRDAFYQEHGKQLARALKVAIGTLDKVANTQGKARVGEDGGPDKWDLHLDRNNRIVWAKDGLKEISRLVGGSE